MDIYPLYFRTVVSPHMCAAFSFRVHSFTVHSSQSSLLRSPMVYNTWGRNDDIYVGYSWNMVPNISNRETLKINYIYRMNIGYIAFFFGTFAFFPQVVDVYKTNNTNGLSLTTLVLFLLSQIFWFMRSFQNNDIALRLTVGVNTIVYSYLVYKKYTNDLWKKKESTTGKKKN